MLGGGGSAGGEELLTVTVLRDEQGYGMKVSGDNPVYVQSVKEHGAAWRAGLRAGDRILRVDGVPVHHHTHQQVVLMIRANPSTVLTVFQPPQSPIRPPITAPQPVNSDKQRQLDFAKVNTVRMMLEQEKKHISELRHELSKVPDMRKQTQLESSERRCAKLQREIDTIVGTQPTEMTSSTPGTPRLRHKPSNTGSPPSNAPNAASFLSGLPRSLSNLTGQSLRNLRQRQTKIQQENTPPLVRQNSDETNNKRRHNNTVPMVPTTCLDNVTPPPLPPRSIRNPLTPNTSPINPLAKPRPSSSVTNVSPSRYYPNQYKSAMHQSMPAPEYREDRMAQFRRSSHSLDGDLEGPQPNSIALQMSYPLVNAPPPPLQMDNRGAVPVLHVRSQSSPEHLDHGLPARPAKQSDEKDGGLWERGTPPPGTPPPPYAHNTQPCADPQRAIISMEEDDSPASDNSTYSGLFSNLRSVRESKARVAVLLNWLLGERRCACANLLLLITDSYRSASGVSNATLRRWAYEIQSSFLMPNAVLQLSGVDENMANEIEHVLSNEYDKDELLRNVFRKARQKAKEELTQQLTEFQVKRQVGLGTLYGPEDAVIEKCDVDKQQELTVVETVMCQRLRAVTGGNVSGCGGRGGQDAHSVLLAALICAAHCLQCRPASVMSAVGGARASFLQRDKLYKQRVKQLTKLNPQPFVVRGHHLQLQALTSVAHCHLCDLVIWGLAPQAAVCTDCNLRVHRACARAIEESCCLDGEHHNNRISRFMERIHHNNQLQAQDSHEKKSRKSSGTANFLNMERSMRKVEDETTWEHALPAAALERRDESDESLYESADCHSDAISASDDALPRLSKTPTISKESLKLAVTDEEVDVAKVKKGHRKAMSLSNPLEMVKSLDWLDAAKKDIDKNCDKKKSRESLWSEEDRDSIHGSTLKLDQVRKNSKKGDKSEASSRKSSTNEQPKLRKPSKASSVSALNLFRRKKTPALKPVEAVVEMIDKILSSDEIVNYTKFFLEEEKRHSSLYEIKPREETDTDEDLPPTPRPNEHRRRLSRQTSRSKSKVRGKSQSVKVNTLRKSHSGTLKKNKKKGTKTPLAARSRQTSIVEVTPLMKKKKSEHTSKQTAWLFSSVRGESRREGSSEEPAAPDGDQDPSDTKELTDKENSWRTAPSNGSGRGVNRAESCRERDAPRRGKHRNASDPNRLTAHNNHDLEPSATTAPSGSSSSSSLSSRSNESNTVAAEQQASQSDWSEEDEPLAAQWADSLPPQVLDSLLLSSKLRKRQEVIHELIVSEGSHVRWLKVLGGVFLRPLESQPALLPPDELRALFPNLPQVRERHGRLYADLRNVRANNHVVQIRPVADAVLSTLGESGYAACLSRFCRGQRMALEALRERRRKNKELHQFLAAREQLPLCGRLQLRDLLACVWQRLTKYQLLLESILATVSDSDHESEEDVATLKCALNTAKDVLHSVDTAIRTAENQHRLRSIQTKLEVRASGAEWEELRRLDLTQHNLRMEGELNIRNDSNKKITVLALMLDDSLVLLQRESDKFILKPIPPPSQQGLLSPLIRWEKVLFRQNAAVRNTFLLVNINGVQMHELSANTQAEYGTWVKYIQDAPLAHLKHTPAVTHRAPEETGTNVSRNPSDASEKSEKSEKSPTPAPLEEKETECAASVEPERDGVISVQRSMNERREEDRDVPSSVSERDGDRSSMDRDSEERERNIPRRPTVGRISTHGRELTAPLEPSGAVRVNEPVAASCAQRVYTHDERLRRLDGVIAKALRAKSAVVAELVGATVDSLPHLAEMAVAETLGQVDVSRELRATRLDRSCSTEEDLPDDNVSVDMHQLLLAAYSQANQLTEALSKAITVSPAGVVAARARSGLCDSCRRHRGDRTSVFSDVAEPPTPDAKLPPPAERDDIKLLDESSLFEEIVDLGHEVSLDMLDDLGAERGGCEPVECETGAAVLATRLLGLTTGLQGSLGRLLTSLPRATSRCDSLRRELVASTDSNHALRARLRNADYQMIEEISVPKDGVDDTIQDQPSNGG